jgi:hypothetical protein
MRLINTDFYPRFFVKTVLSMHKYYLCFTDIFKLKKL